MVADRIEIGLQGTDTFGGRSGAKQLMDIMGRVCEIGSDRLGMGRALDPRRLFALARKNSDASLHVAIVYGLGSIALAAASAALSIVPFAGLLATIALPGIYAIAVPRLATFQVDGRGPGA